MKALGKFFGELMAWRWAPAVGLCVASLFYVLVVVALVPDEIGVPVTNARFAKKVAPPSGEIPEAPTFPTAMMESEAPPPQPAPVQPAGVVDFGRRGFSPPLPRPDPPPAPVVAPPPTPPAPPPVAVAPPVAAPTPQAGLEVPGEVPPAQEAPEAPVASAAPPPPAPGGILRAIRSVLPNQQPPGATPPGAPPSGPPGAPPPAPEAPPAAPDAK